MSIMVEVFTGQIRGSKVSCKAPSKVDQDFNPRLQGSKMQIDRCDTLF